MTVLNNTYSFTPGHIRPARSLIRSMVSSPTLELFFHGVGGADGKLWIAGASGPNDKV